MKCYKQILCVLGGLLVLTLGMLSYWAYKSGVEEQRKDKQTAEMLLKDATVAWVSQEFDKLRIPFSSSGGNIEAKSLRRRMVTATGTFIVNVDSVKEEKNLLSSGLLACMVHSLFVSGSSSVEELNRQWQEKLNMGLPHYYSALELIRQMPSNEKNLQRTIAGDSTFCSAKNKLGDYYLDNMYFLEVKAYLSAPSVWWCVDWGRTDIVVCIGGIVLGICIMAFILTSNRKKNPDNEKEILSPISVIRSDEILSSGETVSGEKVVYCVGNGRYRIYEILFDEIEMTITFGEQVKHCSKQPYKLLSAFIHAEGHFLLDNRIAEICGWNLDDIGVRNKRKTAISQLRKLLESDASCVNIVSTQNEKDEDGFILLISV